MTTDGARPLSAAEIDEMEAEVARDLSATSIDSHEEYAWLLVVGHLIETIRHIQRAVDAAVPERCKSGCNHDYCSGARSAAMVMRWSLTDAGAENT